MTKEQEDALFGFLKGLSIANDDHDAYDALLAAFGRTEPLPTTRQAYYDAGSVPPTAEPVAAEPATATTEEVVWKGDGETPFPGATA